MKSKIITTSILVFLVALVVATQGYFTYSEGERGGYIKKLAKKGYIIKTFEGELVQQISGVLSAESFQFSVQKKEVVIQLQKAMLNNERVNVKYKQKIYIMPFLHGDSQYFITEIIQ